MPRATNLAKMKAGGLLLGAFTLVSCAAPGLWTDFSSVSVGATNDGRIRHPKKMPARGNAWRVPGTWRERGNQYGIVELVAAVQRAATKVRHHDRKAVLGIADLSAKAGGSSSYHRSHQSGRDVDLLFYSRNRAGKILRPPEQEMIRYDGYGKPVAPKKGKPPYKEFDWKRRRFDDELNWRLIEALLSDMDVRVQWIFVSSPLRGRLLRYAKRKGCPQWLIEYAKVVMRAPSRAAPHDDHFHVRIYCPRSDRALGCEDTGPVWRHEKKTIKYGGFERYDPIVTNTVLEQPGILRVPAL